MPKLNQVLGCQRASGPVSLNVRDDQGVLHARLSHGHDVTNRYGPRSHGLAELRLDFRSIPSFYFVQPTSDGGTTDGPHSRSDRRTRQRTADRIPNQCSRSSPEYTAHQGTSVGMIRRCTTDQKKSQEQGRGSGKACGNKAS